MRGILREEGGPRIEVSVCTLFIHHIPVYEVKVGHQ